MTMAIKRVTIELDDAPDITTGIDDFGFTEAADASAQDLSDNGSLSFDDIDTTDVIDVSSSVTGSATWSGGTIDPALATQLENGFSISGHWLQLYGLCAGCKAKKENNSAA